MKHTTISTYELQKLRQRLVRIADNAWPSNRESLLMEIVDIDEELRFRRSIGIDTGKWCGWQYVQV